MIRHKSKTLNTPDMNKSLALRHWNNASRL